MAQKESELSRLNRRLNTLSIFRSILEDDVVGRLQALIDSIGTGSLEEQLRRYGDFTGALFEAGGNITTYVRTFLQDDMNFYLRNNISASFVGDIKTKPKLGAALSVVMMLIMCVVILINNFITKKTTKWESR